jgi:hypothetical protein
MKGAGSAPKDKSPNLSLLLAALAGEMKDNTKDPVQQGDTRQEFPNVPEIRESIGQMGQPDLEGKR